jgi:hypothetical protein
MIKIKVKIEAFVGGAGGGGEDPPEALEVLGGGIWV